MIPKTRRVDSPLWDSILAPTESCSHALRIAKTVSKSLPASSSLWDVLTHRWNHT